MLLLKLIFFVGDIVLPKHDWPYAPMSAQRFVDLITPGGIEDFFSSDLTDAEISEKLGHVDVPAIIFLGDEDEYVPKSVNKKKLLSRWKAAIPGKVTTHVLLKQGHYFSNIGGSSQTFLQKTVEFINTVVVTPGTIRRRDTVASLEAGL